MALVADQILLFLGIPAADMLLGPVGAACIQAGRALVAETEGPVETNVGSARRQVGIQLVAVSRGREMGKWTQPRRGGFSRFSALEN